MGFNDPVDPEPRPRQQVDHASVNRAKWDERAPAHAASPDYRVAELVADPTAVSDVVRFDLPRLGDLVGLRGVHLQCHIGTDTVSLARRGASMTGLDFSPAAIDEARLLARRCRLDVDFVVSDVHDALGVLGSESFDLVYTGVGALCWLPSIRRWAAVVAGLLRPGGRIFLREGHPMLWALAEPDPEEGGLRVEHPYFEQVEPVRWEEPGSYVATPVQFEHNVGYEWNHGVGEVVGALLEQGLRLTDLVEHDSVPWDALPGLMEPVGGGEYRLAERPERLAASYTLQAVKPA